MSFLDVQIIHEDKTFTTSVYHKPTVNGVYTHLDSFLQSTFKFGTVYMLTQRYFQICSSWTKLHTAFVCLKEIFLKNGYPENLQINVLKDLWITAERKPLVLVFPYLGSIFLQTRTKLKKLLKNILVVNCKQCLIVRPYQVTIFISKIAFPKIVLLVLFINFTVDSAIESYYGECVRPFFFF